MFLLLEVLGLDRYPQEKILHIQVMNQGTGNGLIRTGIAWFVGENSYNGWRTYLMKFDVRFAPKPLPVLVTL